MSRSLPGLAGLLVPAMFTLALCVATDVFAADDRVTLDVGLHRFQSYTDVSVAGATGRGTGFELERLGTPSNKTVVRIEGTIRPFERHRFRLIYLETDREATATSDRDLGFGNLFVPIGSSATARFKVRSIAGDYLYSLWKTDDSEVAASLGIHQTRFAASLHSSAMGISAETEA